jgi:hypothetical protein
MKDRVSERKRRERRAYTKPRLRSIDLVADQVLGVGCKLDGGGLGAVVGCTLNNCVNAGS